MGVKLESPKILKEDKRFPRLDMPGMQSYYLNAFSSRVMLLFQYKCFHATAVLDNRDWSHSEQLFRLTLPGFYRQSTGYELQNFLEYSYFILFETFCESQKIRKQFKSLITLRRIYKVFIKTR